MSENEVAIPEKAHERLRASIAQLQQMKQLADTYFKGICDGLGLEGEWNLDLQRMVAIRQDIQGQQEQKQESRQEQGQEQ